METAKQARTSAKRLLTMAQNQVQSAIDQDMADEIIASRLLKAEQQLQELMDKYQQYLGYAYPNEEPISEEDDQWFQKISLDYDRMESTAHSRLKGSAKDAQFQNEVVRKEDDQSMTLKRQCEYDEMILESMLDHVEDCMRDEDAAADTIKTAQMEAKNQLDKYCDLVRQITISESDRSRDDSMQKVKLFISKFNSIKIEVGKAIELKGQSHNKQTHEKSIFKLDKMKLPEFDGNIRSYPRFISDFKKIVLPNIQSTESASYVLRNCLSGSARESVRNIDDDVDAMLERLNERFGRSSKLADSIMNDIKHMKKVNDGDDKGFLNMINLLESSYNDLKRIGLHQEISNSTIVSMVEEKMPKSIKDQWCLKLCDEEENNVDDTDKFPALLKFLLKHKRAVEYGNNDLRISQTANRDNLQRSGTTNLGQGSSKSPRETCWIHKGDNGSHPIWQCEEFIKMSVPERLALVSKNKACIKCLLMKCPGATISGQCWMKFKCKEQGCGKEHNQLLHEDNSNKKLEHEQANHAFNSVDHSYNNDFNIGDALLPTQ